MRTTEITFLVTLVYESDELLNDSDRAACLDELVSTLNNASSNGELDPPGRTIQCYTLEAQDQGANHANDR